ncbi:hypothetical protein P7C73_g4289, partial [Tremellales sp. Uapishka_1]
MSASQSVESGQSAARSAALTSNGIVTGARPQPFVTENLLPGTPIHPQGTVVTAILETGPPGTDVETLRSWYYDIPLSAASKEKFNAEMARGNHQAAAEAAAEDRMSQYRKDHPNSNSLFDFRVVNDSQFQNLSSQLPGGWAKVCQDTELGTSYLHYTGEQALRRYEPIVRSAKTEGEDTDSDRG